MKWLVPGMNIKRWLILLFLGVVGFSLGAGLVALYVLRAVRLEGTASTAVAATTLQFIPRVERAVIIVGIGLIVVVISLLRLSRSLLSVVLPGPRSQVAEMIYRRRKLPRGPRVVAIGAGSGLSSVLRGMKEYTSNLTAVVTVAEPAGGTAGWDESFGILPGGDVGDCIVAMSDEEPLMGRLFLYRFGAESGLEGHSFGSLFIVALAHITGSFEKALREIGRVLAVRGQILPSTLSTVRLVVQAEGDAYGACPAPAPTEPLVRIEPAEVVAYADAVRAIREADMVVIGPGNLLTGVLPTVLIPGIHEALLASRALKVFVGNVASEAEDPAGGDVLEQVKLLQSHAGSGLFDYVVANDNVSLTLPPLWGSQLVRCSGPLAGDLQDLRLVEMDVIDTEDPRRHHAGKLSEALMKLFYDQSPRRRAALTSAAVTAA